MRPIFFRRGAGPHDLAVSMIGVKLGDRLLQIGCGDGGLLSALAAKTGLTGRAAAIDPSPDVVTRARRAAERAGVLVEIFSAPPPMLPFDAAAFDVVVLLDVLRPIPPEARVALLREGSRVLRAGGRAIIVEPAPRGGLAALVSPRREATYSPEEWLRSEGFRAVRTLAEREGLLFVEGVSVH
jgi:ubiquinone/menaquinone biosynthesis C-methylase UbiE